MEDFEELVEEGKKRKINIMLDMVFNHTSTEHKWFKEALKGNEKYMNYYIFKEGKMGKNQPIGFQNLVEILGNMYLI